MIYDTKSNYSTLLSSGKTQQEQRCAQNRSLYSEEDDDGPPRGKSATVRTAEGIRFGWLRNKAVNLEMKGLRWNIIVALQSADSCHKRFGGHCCNVTAKGRRKIRSVGSRGLS